MQLQASLWVHPGNTDRSCSICQWTISNTRDITWLLFMQPYPITPQQGRSKPDCLDCPEYTGHSVPWASGSGAVQPPWHLPHYRWFSYLYSFRRWENTPCCPTAVLLTVLRMRRGARENTHQEKEGWAALFHLLMNSSWGFPGGYLTETLDVFFGIRLDGRGDLPDSILHWAVLHGINLAHHGC